MTKSDVLAKFQTAFTRYHAALPRLFPKRKEISVTLPIGQTTFTYSDSWITADTSCYAHNLETTGIKASVSWTFAAGSVTFTLGAALDASVTFNFGMIKGGIG